MDGLVKASLILGACIIIAVAIWVHFSPYQTCVRAYSDEKNSPKPEFICARALRSTR